MKLQLFCEQNQEQCNHPVPVVSIAIQLNQIHALKVIHNMGVCQSIH